MNKVTGLNSLFVCSLLVMFIWFVRRTNNSYRGETMKIVVCSLFLCFVIGLIASVIYKVFIKKPDYVRLEDGGYKWLGGGEGYKERLGEPYCRVPESKLVDDQDDYWEGSDNDSDEPQYDDGWY